MTTREAFEHLGARAVYLPGDRRERRGVIWGVTADAVLMVYDGAEQFRATEPEALALEPPK